MPDINIGDMIGVVSENLSDFPCIVSENEGDFIGMGSLDMDSLNSTISYNLGDFIFINDS